MSDEMSDEQSEFPRKNKWIRKEMDTHASVDLASTAREFDRIIEKLEDSRLPEAQELLRVIAQAPGMIALGQVALLTEALSVCCELDRQITSHIKNFESDLEQFREAVADVRNSIEMLQNASDATVLLKLNSDRELADALRRELLDDKYRRGRGYGARSWFSWMPRKRVFRKKEVQST